MRRNEIDQRDGSIHLLMVADSLDVGGAEQHLVALASALVQRGHRITLACSTGGSLASVAQQAGVIVRPLLRRKIKRCVSPTFIWQLTRLVHQNRYDLVHAHMYASVVASAWATQGTGVPLIITEHSEASWRSPSACWWSCWSYRRAQRIIAVSRQIERRLIEYDKVPANAISVIMNALSPISEHPACTRANLPVEAHGSPLVGVVARLQPEKGVTYFLQAAARVLQQMPEARFLVIGDGPLRDTLQTYAAQLGVQEHVHFLGFRSDARALIRLLDILVVPSLSEGTPLVTLEAMAAGVPVVASAVGGIPEQICYAREGLLVPPQNVGVLSSAILYLLQEPDWARRLGEAGRRRVASQFSFSTMLQQTEALYHLALGWPLEHVVEQRDDYEPLVGVRR